VSGIGNLLSKGGIDIDVSPTGHVWVELGMRIFFPRSSVAGVARVSRAKKDSKASMQQKFWTGVQERLKASDSKAALPSSSSFSSAAATLANGTPVKA
jgi:hypothetical protein